MSQLPPQRQPPLPDTVFLLLLQMFVSESPLIKQKIDVLVILFYFARSDYSEICVNSSPVHRPRSSATPLEVSPRRHRVRYLLPPPNRLNRPGTVPPSILCPLTVNGKSLHSPPLCPFELPLYHPGQLSPARPPYRIIADIGVRTVASFPTSFGLPT